MPLAKLFSHPLKLAARATVSHGGLVRQFSGRQLWCGDNSHRRECAHVLAEPVPMQPLQLAIGADQEDVGVEPLQQAEIALAHRHVRGRIAQLELQLDLLVGVLLGDLDARSCSASPRDRSGPTGTRCWRSCRPRSGRCWPSAPWRSASGPGWCPWSPRSAASQADPGRDTACAFGP